MHQGSDALTGFCPFPDDITPQDVTPHHIPGSDLMTADPALAAGRCAPLRDAFIAGAPLAQWRETYKGTDIGQDFMDRFACYCLIGAGGAFHSARMAAWVVYMPPHLYYPWHHHPGEEMYFVIAGSAEFRRRGEADNVLSEGQSAQHRSNQPHAMETHDSPVMAYVVWRNGFATPPVLTEARDENHSHPAL